MKICLSCLLFLFCLLVTAQEDKVDSLKKILSKPGRDTNEVRTLNELAKKLMFVNPDTAITLSSKALELSNAIKWSYGTAQSLHLLGKFHSDKSEFNEALTYYNKALLEWQKLEKQVPARREAYILTRKSATLGNMGVIYYNLGNYDEALKYYAQAMKIDQALANKTGVTRNLTNIGVLNNDKGEYRLALSYFLRASKLSRELNDKNLMAINLGNIGLADQNLGNYPDALTNYFEALNIAEELNDQGRAATQLGNIGLVYWNQHDLTKALDFYARATKTYSALGDSGGLALTYGNIGLVYLDRKEFELSLNYMQKALQIDRSIGNNAGVARHLGNIGIVYYQQHELTKAIDKYKQALEIDRLLGNKNGVARQLGNIGAIFLEEKKYTDAATFLSRAVQLCDSIGALKEQMQFEKNLVDLYAATNRFDQSLAHYKKYIACRDSLFNEQNTKKQTRLEMNYEFERKVSQQNAEQEKKDAVAAAENKKHKIILLAISVLGLLVSGFAVFAYRSFLQKKKVNEEITKQKHLIEEKQKEILDSIYYARRIQRSLLSNENYITKSLQRLLKM